MRVRAHERKGIGVDPLENFDSTRKYTRRKGKRDDMNNFICVLRRHVLPPSVYARSHNSREFDNCTRSDEWERNLCTRARARQVEGNTLRRILVSRLIQRERVSKAETRRGRERLLSTDENLR